MAKVNGAKAVNEMAKSRSWSDIQAGKAKPYEVWTNGQGWTWVVLKAYQAPDKEAKNDYARRFCAVGSPMTQGSYDLGDTYFSPTDGPQDGGAVCVWRDATLTTGEHSPRVHTGGRVREALASVGLAWLLA